jgi:anti-sigma regulatory factor (Ser/Thr protein kinase)
MVDGSRGRPGAAGAQPWYVRQITLPAADQAPGLARLATREALALYQMAHVAETALLLVSELVTNSVRHASTGVALRLEITETWLRIEVHDAEPRGPQLRTPGVLDESGFGLVIVDALATKWGVYETAAGKAVWAELLRALSATWSGALASGWTP